jgi:hypothetical protein
MSVYFSDFGEISHQKNGCSGLAAFVFRNFCFQPTGDHS